MTSSDTPLEATDRWARWHRLISALDEVDLAWHAVQDTEPAAPRVLPGHLVATLADSTGRSTAAIAGLAALLDQRLDSDNAFRDSAHALQHACDRWPTGETASEHWTSVFLSGPAHPTPR